MDITSIFDINFILVLAVLLLITYLYVTWPYSYFKKLGIPCDVPVPFLGSFSDLARNKSIIQIDEDNIKKYGKVFGLCEGWTMALMAADPEIVKDVCIKQASSFVDRRKLLFRGLVRHSVFDVTGAQWKRLRSLSTPFFSTGKLKKNSKRISAVLTNVQKYLQQKSAEKTEIEAKDFGSCFTMEVICSVVFGIDTNLLLRKEEHPITTNSRKMIQDFAPGNPWFLFPFFFPAIARILERFFEFSMFRREPMEYIAKLCKQLLQEREKGNQDAEIFVTALLKAHEEDLDYESKQALGVTEDVKYKGMTDEEILAQAMLFILAGYDTTATTLAFLLHSLTENQDVQQTLYEDIQKKIGDQPVSYENVQSLDYLSWCVDEALRLYPAAPRTDRICNEDDVTVAGIPLKKGHSVIVPIWYLQHNPEVWPDPYKFDPLRFSPEGKEGRHPYNFVPFGVGPRICIGMRLALLEMKMFVTSIVQRYKLVPNAKTVPVVLDPTSLFPVAVDGLWFSVQQRE